MPVFFDVERIHSGEAFAEEIDENLASCDVFIAVIGRSWLKAADEYGRRRLDLHDDYVRMEIAAALTRGLHVIPLLIEDAELPLPEALPGDLVRLPDLQVANVRHATFRDDVGRLIEDIGLRVKLKQGIGLEVPNVPAGTIRTNPKDESEYVWVPPGTFWMGRVPGDNVIDERYDDEKPRHPVQISRGFWLGRTPVTVAAYRRFTAARKLAMPRPPKDNPNWAEHQYPIVNVTWARAREYSAWIGGRLPTEAQWEYAARGGVDGKIYPWGDTIPPELGELGRQRDVARDLAGRTVHAQRIQPVRHDRKRLGVGRRLVSGGCLRHPFVGASDARPAGLSQRDRQARGARRLMAGDRGRSPDVQPRLSNSQ